MFSHTFIRHKRKHKPRNGYLKKSLYLKEFPFSAKEREIQHRSLCYSCYYFNVNTQKSPFDPNNPMCADINIYIYIY